MMVLPQGNNHDKVYEGWRVGNQPDGSVWAYPLNAGQNPTRVLVEGIDGQRTSDGQRLTGGQIRVWTTRGGGQLKVVIRETLPAYREMIAQERAEPSIDQQIKLAHTQWKELRKAYNLAMRTNGCTLPIAHFNGWRLDTKHGESTDWIIGPDKRRFPAVIIGSDSHPMFASRQKLSNGGVPVWLKSFESFNGSKYVVVDPPRFVGGFPLIPVLGVSAAIFFGLFLLLNRGQPQTTHSPNSNPAGLSK